MWSFEWWPHALTNGLNPFVPDIIWTSDGANLTQGGFGIPAATIALAPVTAAAGPVVAYNVASVLMPVLAAWFAYRLCLYLTHSFGQLLSEQVDGADVQPLRDFITRRHVTAVVVEEQRAGPWPLLLQALGLAPVKTGGVLFYRVPAGWSA
jgi:hypothetical protein